MTPFLVKNAFNSRTEILPLLLVSASSKMAPTDVVKKKRGVEGNGKGEYLFILIVVENTVYIIIIT